MVLPNYGKIVPNYDRFYEFTVRAGGEGQISALDSLFWWSLPHVRVLTVS